VNATEARWSIVPIHLGNFRFAADEPHAGEPGVVIGYAVHQPGRLLLFDTGFGFGNAELDAHYQIQARRVDEALAAAGIDTVAIDAVVNCHLHVDHAGQNARFPGIPILVQTAEWDVAHTTEHTILEWIDAPGLDYRIIDGDHEVAPGVRIISTPGHTLGHQSLTVTTDRGLVILAGQAVYSVGEWMGDPTAREGRSRAPDPAAYDRSIARLRGLDPVEVRFAHDVGMWRRVER
jgi:N-acyl homoserine lactone hydrolase